MQDRYVGDIGDYLKLALLRALMPDRSLGILWFRYPDESHNNDGGHIGYLEQPDRWRRFDPLVFDTLRRMVAARGRTLAALETSPLLPNATFFSATVPVSGRRAERLIAREAWFAQACAALQDADLVFLDPDNGLETTNFDPGAARAGKSVSVDELVGLRRSGRAILVYHHQTRRAGGHLAEITHWQVRLRERGFATVDAIRARPFSPRVFFLLDADPTLRSAAAEFARRWGPELVSWHTDPDVADASPLGSQRASPTARAMTDLSPALKAETLVEALPYLQRYAGKTFVVKYGGHAMGDPEAARDFAEDVVLLKAVGINPVVVHGGGPQIGAMLKRLGVESRFVDGLRVTDAETAKVAEMILAGSINKEIVAWIAQAGGRAVGISGKDAGLVQAEKVGGRREADPLQGIERHVDLGFVGEPVAVDATILRSLSRDGIIPVVAPIGLGADGHTYNINADTVAGAIAAELKAARFFLLTDVAGVLDKDKQLVTDLTPAGVAALRADGTITGGMIPKLETCVAAVEAGVDAAVVIDGRVPHAMLLEIFTKRGAGTLIRR